MPRSRIVALVVLVTMLFACQAKPPDETRADRTVRLMLPIDPSSLSIIGKTDYNGDVIANLVSEGLVRYDADLTLVPRLATSWELSDDRRVVTFRLRDDVRWHDGAPLTAHDVVFTVEKVLDPATEARTWVGQFEDVETIEATDDHTVVVTYARPYADFLDAWQLPIVPAHLAGGDEDFLTGSFAANPVGCGAFRFVRWSPGHEIVLETNRDYWDGAPEIDGIVFRILPNERTAYEALMRGDLDLMAVPPDRWRETREAGRDDGLVGFVYYRMNVWYVGWNSGGSNPFFDDPRVRRAMVLALDRERFVARVMGGLAKPAITTYHPDSPWADARLAALAFDPEEAARLLDAAGWVDTDGDGVRERDGRRFAFTLLAPVQIYEIGDRMTAWMQQALAAIGVEMQIDKMEWRAFQERRRAGTFEAAMASFVLTPTPDQYQVYHTTAVETGLNYVRFSDPDVDRLLEDGRVEFDPEKRRRIYDEVQDRLHELQPISPLFYVANPVLHHDHLVGVEASALGLFHFTPGPKSWRVSRAPGGG